MTEGLRNALVRNAFAHKNSIWNVVEKDKNDLLAVGTVCLRSLNLAAEAA
jgi:hypothetical protein